MGGAASRLVNSALYMMAAIQGHFQRRNQPPPPPPRQQVEQPATLRPSQDLEAAAGDTARSTVRQRDIATGAAHRKWLLRVLGFCFTALGTAVQCLQILQTVHHHGLPLTYYLFCFILILTLVTLFLSNYIPHDFLKIHIILASCALCGMLAAFFLVVTMPFPLWLNLTTWACLLGALLVVVLLLYCFLPASNPHGN